MRTKSEREEARKDVYEAADDKDVAVVMAILELCVTIDDAVEGFLGKGPPHIDPELVRRIASIITPD